jgi:hypothetical protein
MRVIVQVKRLSPGETWAVAGALVVALATGWVVGMGIMAMLGA